jgi:hypothetical protein
MVFRVIIPFSLERSRRFGGTYRLHFRRTRQATNQQQQVVSYDTPVPACLFSVIEVGGDA